MRLKILLLCTAAVSLSLAARAHNTSATNTGKEEAKKSDILGGVTHSQTKEPLDNVVVTAYLANKKEQSVVTDRHGHYAFNELKPGTYRIVFEKNGYKKVTREKKVLRIDEGLQIHVSLDEFHRYDFPPGPALFFDQN